MTEHTTIKSGKVTDATFTATRFDTADDKARIAAQLITFIGGGYPRHRFTKRLYNTLTHMFGHIGHCDADGFYDTWFSTLKAESHVSRQRPRGQLRGRPALHMV